MEQFYGFFVIFFMIILSILKKIFEEKKRYNEQVEKRERILQQTLKEKRLVAKKLAPKTVNNVVHRQVTKDHVLHSDIEHRHNVSQVEKRQLHSKLDYFDPKTLLNESVTKEWGENIVHVERRSSYVKNLLKNQRNKRDIFIMSEIVNAPFR